MLKQGASEDKTIGRALFVGSVYMLSMRWVMRLMGLVSTVILARVLTPGDFGLVAVATVFQGLLEVIVSLNVELALFRNLSAERDFYDTAWTISVVQFALLSAILFGSADWVASYYEDARLAPIIHVFSFSLLAFGFTNIGIIDFRRDLEFRKDLQFNLLVNASRVVFSILFAFLLRNYWAIVIGMVASTLVRLPLSYAMSPYRPRFDLRRAKDIWRISVSVWLIDLSKFLDMSADRLILGRLTEARTLGGYSVAVDLARMPSAEMIMPITRALIPGYAKVRENIQELRSITINLFHAVAVIAMPIAAGLPIITPDLVSVVLGSKWIFIIPFMRIAAVMGVIELVALSARPLILAAGDIKPFTRLSLLGTAVGLTSIYPAYRLGGVELVLLGFILVRFSILLVLFYFCSQVLNVSFRKIVRPFFSPLLAALAMSSLLVLLDLGWLPNVARLFVDVILGGLTYVLVLLVIWRLSGGVPAVLQVAVNEIGKSLLRWRVRS